MTTNTKKLAAMVTARANQSFVEGKKCNHVIQQTTPMVATANATRVFGFFICVAPR
jgi:hypothetical protein